MSVNADKLIQYAARGIPNSQIAAALGVTPGRITQLLDNPKVAGLVQDAKYKLAQEEIDNQTSLAQARTSLLNRLPDLIGATESLSEAVNALEKLNRLKEPTADQRRKTADATLITMELPAFLRSKVSIELTSQNEIIEIEGRSMATLPTTETHALIKKRQQDEQDSAADTVREGEDAPG